MTLFHEIQTEIMMEYFYPLKSYEKKIKAFDSEEINLEDLSVILEEGRFDPFVLTLTSKNGREGFREIMRFFCSCQMDEIESFVGKS